MKHPIYQVTSVESVDAYTLRVGFDDRTSQIIDFRPVLQGELYEPLRDPDAFAQVHIDPEVHTLVWPNGADFDPATLHDWAKYEEDMVTMAGGWLPVRT